MSSVDNRSVHMTFDNAAFERNMAQTMRSMDELKKKLDFTNAHKSFSELESATRGFQLSSIGSAVDNISSKFSAMGAIAFSVLNNIVTRAIDTGINLVKSISVAPIMDGFREMETNMNSIQTILANTASKGSTLEDVNAALNTLNEYSDQTIYNFSQMARNIGTFTAAGIDLDTSVNAIKGIANLAAISGSNAEQASTAMYQLSQALATGKVALIDWNSVVNAGMGGEVFQKALFETGKALGTIADVPMSMSFDEWKKAGNSFRASLESGWLTAEVLTNTLQGFTGDLDEAQLKALGYTDEQIKEIIKLGELGKAAATEVKTLTQLLGTVRESVGSGWSKTFQIVIGDFEEAKSLFTGLSNTIGGFVQDNADARNDILQDWKDLGGRTILLKALELTFKSITNVIEPFRDAFRELFPPLTGQTLFELTQRFRDFADRLEDFTRLHGPEFRRIAEGITSVIQIVVEVLKQARIAIIDFIGGFTGNADAGDVLDFFAKMGDRVVALKELLVDDGGIARFFAELVEFIRDPLPAIKELKDRFLGFFDGIDFGSFDGVVKAFTRIKELIEELISNIFDIDFKFPEGITNFFDRFSESVDKNTTNSLAGGFDRLTNALEKVWDILKKVGEAFGWIFDKMTDLAGFGIDAVQGVWDFITNIGPNLQKAFMSDEFDQFLETLQTIAAVLGGAGFAGIAKNGLGVNLNADLTGGSLPKLGEAFQQLGGTFYAVRTNLEGLTGVFSAMQTQIKAGALLKIAIAIGVLTASVVVLSLVDPEALAKSLSALSVGFGQLIGSMALLSAISTGPKGAATLAGLATGMIAMASAVLILALAVKSLSGLDWNELGKGLAGVTALLAAIVGTAKFMQASAPAMIGGGIGMIAIAVALNVLAGAVMLFATMSWEEMGKGLAGVATGLLLIVGAVNMLPPSTILIGPGLVAVAFALNLLAGAVMLFATMSWTEMAKGMAGIGAGLLIIAGAMHLMPLSTIITGPGLMAVATALVILAGALKIFATMSWEEIGKAMATLGASLLILAGGLHLMQGTLVGAAAVGIAGVSLLVLAKALKEFAKMGWKELAKGLVGMAAALGVLGLAGLALSPVIGSIFLLGVALLALGAGFALIGVGAGLLAEAFQIIAAAGTAGIDVLMYAIDQLLIRLPDMIKAFANGIVGMADMLLDAAPELISKMSEIIQSLLQLIIDNAPKVGEAFGTYIKEFLKVIRDASPDFVKTGMKMLLDFLHGVEDNIAEITKTVAKIILEFLNALRKELPELVQAGFDLLLTFLSGVIDNIDDVAEAGLEMVASLLEGIADGIDDVIAAAVDIVEAVIEELGKSVNDLADAGLQMILDMISGISENMMLITTQGTLALIAFIAGIGKNIVLLANAAADMVIELLHGLADAIDDHDEEFADAAFDLAWAIVNGIVTAVGLKKVKDALWNIGKNIASGIKDGFLKALGIKSPSKVFMELAGEIPAGIVKGLDQDRTAAASGEQLGQRIADRFKNSIFKGIRSTISNLREAIQMVEDVNPTISPVLDLTNVKGQIEELKSYLPQRARIFGEGNLNNALSVSRDISQSQEDQDIGPKEPIPRDVTFIQNNNSPRPLSTATVYRQTRNLLEIRKKELENV